MAASYTDLITTPEALRTWCTRASAHPFITIDTEFLREKTYYPKLCLIQIGLPDGAAVAIDPLVLDDLSPVIDLFLNPAVIKVIHSGRQDLEIFFNMTGKVVTPLFDTQIAAMVCGYGDSVGYEALVRDITGNALDKTSQFTNWSQRPLSERQLHYALADVQHLVPIYHHMQKKLQQMARETWLQAEEEILADPATYQVLPQEMWRKIKLRTAKPKNLVVLQALAAWREERAQEKNLPRPWIMRDETIADLAGQMPKTVEQLKRIRGFSGDMADGTIGRTILQVIDSALRSDPSTWPALPERKNISPATAAMAEILRTLLKINAYEVGITPKLVASTEDLEALAADDHADIPALKGWRLEVFGHEALDLKNGRLAIGIKNGKITKISLTH